MMIEQHKKRHARQRVAPAFGMTEATYNNDEEHSHPQVSYSNTTAIDSDDSDSEINKTAEAPKRQLTNSEWSLKRKKSTRQVQVGNWEKWRDDEQQYDYYYNTVTGESQWERPDDYIEN